MARQLGERAQPRRWLASRARVRLAQLVVKEVRVGIARRCWVDVVKVDPERHVELVLQSLAAEVAHERREPNKLRCVPDCEHDGLGAVVELLVGSETRVGGGASDVQEEGDDEQRGDGDIEQVGPHREE